MDWKKDLEGKASFEIIVKTNSSKTEVKEFKDGCYKVNVKALPERLHLSFFTVICFVTP